MLSSLRKLFGGGPAAPTSALPPGVRVYAVGDIHGRADLLQALIAAVDADDAARGPAQTTVILLGDLVDRGADSAGVIALARAWQARRTVRIIAGNHEEMFLDSFADVEVLRHFLRHGGKETVLSYPVDPGDYAVADYEQTQTLMEAAIPRTDREYLASFEDMIRIGDYLFVHAGIRPEVPLAEQETKDLRWIRAIFTDCREDYGFTVVHGHTITPEVDVQPNRIGIDTGAYASGRLTALGLEGTSRWVIQTNTDDGQIAVTTRSMA